MKKKLTKTWNGKIIGKKRTAINETTGSKKYPTPTKVVALLAGLPASNAQVERLFSSLKLIKTERRSLLKLSSLVLLMQTGYFLKNNGVAAAEYAPGTTEYNLFKIMKANATDKEAREQF